MPSLRKVRLRKVSCPKPVGTTAKTNAVTSSAYKILWTFELYAQLTALCKNSTDRALTMENILAYLCILVSKLQGERTATLKQISDYR